jgi:HK97 family phage prohead protease
MEKNKTKREYMTRELRASEDADSRRIEGYAIVFNTPSALMGVESRKPVYEMIAPEAVTKEMLDGCDIRMNLYHDRHRLLARSKKGVGTLEYSVDEKGVHFVFEPPRTPDGDTAFELVRSGALDGCSFAFYMDYSDDTAVSREDAGDRVIYTIRKIQDIDDFTLTDRPAYPDTECAAREAAAREASQASAEGVAELRRLADRGV